MIGGIFWDVCLQFLNRAFYQHILSYGNILELRDGFLSLRSINCDNEKGVLGLYLWTTLLTASQSIMCDDPSDSSFETQQVPCEDIMAVTWPKTDQSLQAFPSLWPVRVSEQETQAMDMNPSEPPNTALPAVRRSELLLQI